MIGPDRRSGSAIATSVLGAATRQARRSYFAARVRMLAHQRFASRPVARDVIVSLTSYPARLPYLRLPLLSLLHQTARPQNVILVLADEEFPDRRLPAWLEALCGDQLQILWTPQNIRSYKKLLPVLTSYPDMTIVTADDDIIYPPDWLEVLLAAGSARPDRIVGYRGTTVSVKSSRELKPYADWPTVTQATMLDLTFLTGCAGCVYRPGQLAPDVGDVVSALRLCPTGDDVWFWAMSLLAGTRMQSIAPGFRDFPAVRKSKQVGTLMATNVTAGQNDRQLKAVLDHYDLWPAVIAAIR